LARIANPASSQEWTLEKAKRDWYWGYLQHASVTAKNVFDDWMWWCGELHLLHLQDATAATAKWQSLPRAKLDNAINEAQNWLMATVPTATRLWLPSWNVFSAMTASLGFSHPWASRLPALKRWKRTNCSRRPVPPLTR
jgi:hypothetical protein